MPTAVLTNAGPSLLYPADGGIELFLQDETFMGAKPEQIKEALKEIATIPD